MRRVSSASFIIEPGNLWRRRIARRFLDRAPVVDASDGEAAFRLPSENLRQALAAVPWHDDPIASQADSWLRVEALEAAGIDAEMIFPTFAWHLLAITEQAFRNACLEAYNDWLMDFYGASPWRLNGAALVSGGAFGPAEIRRCAARGARAIVIGVNGRDPVDAAIAAAIAADLPMLLTRAGAATPATDLAAFAQDAEQLALAHCAAGARYIVLGPGPALKPPLLRVTSDQAARTDAWGRLGGPGQSEGTDQFLRSNGVDFLGLKTGR